MYAAHHTFVLDPLQCDGHTYNNTLLLPTIKTKPVQTISIPSCLLQLTAIKQTKETLFNQENFCIQNIYSLGKRVPQTWNYGISNSPPEVLVWLGVLHAQ